MLGEKKSVLRGEKHTLAALWLLSFFLLFYFLRSPNLAAGSVRSALEVCAVGLIPSLFPFIVLVSIINSSGLSAQIARVIGYPLGCLFGINSRASSAILLGALGGFPIGAVCARELYSKGDVTKAEAERLIAFTNNASPAFCIGAVGTALFSDTSFGVRLYIAQISAAIIIGILGRKKTCVSTIPDLVPSRASISESVTSAISGAAVSMLKICAFTVFFAVVGDALCAVLHHYFGSTAAALGALLCELTLGARMCSVLDSGISRVLCALAIGWSGISVHLQVASILSDSGLSMRRYYICKLIQGILSALIIFAIM